VICSLSECNKRVQIVQKRHLHDLHLCMSLSPYLADVMVFSGLHARRLRDRVRVLPKRGKPVATA